jgi:hypothetical protein
LCEYSLLTAFLIDKLQFDITIITTVCPFVDDVSEVIIRRERALTHHAIVFPVGQEDELIVGEAQRIDVCIALDDDVTLTPASLPCAYDILSQATPVVISCAAGREEEKEKETKFIEIK